MCNPIIELMINYNGSDVPRINHALKVHGFADYIAAKEQCDGKTKEIICIASILHDIGIHNAEKKYNSNAGNYQELEGPIVASELLKNIDIPNDILERVFYLIGHHHSYNKIDGIDFQILVEADFLVNIFEDRMEGAAIDSVKEKIFRTASGLYLLKSLYGK